MDNTLFKSKPVKITTLAEYLKQIRTQLNLDIKTVSLLAQIKQIYLENLEAGNFKALPAEVYIRGFLKSLAAIYTVSEKQLIEQFEKEYGFEVKGVPIEDKKELRIKFTPKTIILIISIVLVLGALGYIGSQLRSVLAPPYLEVIEPAFDSDLSGARLEVLGVTEIGSDVTINKQVVVVDKTGKFSENLLLQSGLNIIEIEATNKFGKSSKVIRKINAEIPSILLLSKEGVTVTVKIGPESAWIYLEVDGVMVTRGTMLAGSERTVSAKKEILLTSANAGSTTVIYNGKDLGKLGRPGEVVRNVEFAAQAL